MAVGSRLGLGWLVTGGVGVGYWDGSLGLERVRPVRLIEDVIKDRRGR